MWKSGRYLNIQDYMPASFGIYQCKMKIWISTMECFWRVDAWYLQNALLLWWPMALFKSNSSQQTFRWIWLKRSVNLLCRKIMRTVTQLQFTSAVALGVYLLVCLRVSYWRNKEMVGFTPNMKYLWQSFSYRKSLKASPLFLMCVTRFEMYGSGFWLSQNWQGYRIAV